MVRLELDGETELEFAKTACVLFLIFSDENKISTANTLSLHKPVLSYFLFIYEAANYQLICISLLRFTSPLKHQTISFSLDLGYFAVDK